MTIQFVSSFFNWIFCFCYSDFLVLSVFCSILICMDFNIFIIFDKRNEMALNSIFIPPLIATSLTSPQTPFFFRHFKEVF